MVYPCIFQRRGKIVNAADHAHSLTLVHSLASVTTLVKQHFPAASVNLKPWRDDPETREWLEQETLDLAFHFPGWTPRLQCRSFLMQLRVSREQIESTPYLVGVLIRGMTYESERWRLVTLGDWELTGSHLPHPDQIAHFREICQDLFALFPRPPQ